MVFSLEPDRNPLFEVDLDDDQFDLKDPKCFDSWLPRSPSIAGYDQLSPNLLSIQSSSERFLLSPEPLPLPSASASASAPQQSIALPSPTTESCDQSLTEILNCTDSQLVDIIKDITFFDEIDCLSIDEIDAVLDGNNATKLENVPEAGKPLEKNDDIEAIIYDNYDHSLIPIVDENIWIDSEVQDNTYLDDNANVNDSDQFYDQPIVTDQEKSTNEEDGEQTETELENDPKKTTRRSARRARKLNESDLPKAPKSLAITVETRRGQKRRRRNLSVDDEQIKHQNKVAALKYRERKRSEQRQQEEALAKYEAQNRILKNQVAEIEMEIRVFKELLTR